jgi:hypothetical protein
LWHTRSKLYKKLAFLFKIAKWVILAKLVEFVVASRARSTERMRGNPGDLLLPAAQRVNLSLQSVNLSL